MNDQMIFALARNMLAANPEKAQSALGQQLTQILDSGDYAKGAEIGNNLCQTYGEQKNNAVQRAMQFFGMRR